MAIDVSPGAARPRRRRRSPQDARKEILEAAAALLAERPAHEVTVLAVMERTTLSRKSFYVYFPDRSALFSALVRPLRAEVDAAVEAWRVASEPRESGRRALLSAARTYRDHGPALRAVFWSSADDADMATVRRQLAAPVVEIGTGLILNAAPDTRPAEARAIAEALVTMNIHCMLGLSPSAGDHELSEMVETLAVIWERTIFHQH